MTQANPFIDSFKDAFKKFGELPANQTFDMNPLLQAQRRNAEVFSAVSQVITESVQAIARRQAEILQAGTTEMLQLAKDVAASSSPETAMATQTAFAKTNFENSLSNTRELAEIVSKSSIEVFDVLSKKLSENVDESLKTAAKKKTA